MEPPHVADELARAVIGAAIAVHQDMGPGFLESMYEQALMIELTTRGVAFEARKEINVQYRGYRVGKFRLDLVVGNALIVELKCVEELIDVHFSQVSSYLRASGLPLGLLLNFNRAVLRHGIRRVLPRSF